MIFPVLSKHSSNKCHKFFDFIYLSSREEAILNGATYIRRAVENGKGKSRESSKDWGWENKNVSGVFGCDTDSKLTRGSFVEY